MYAASLSRGRSGGLLVRLVADGAPAVRAAALDREQAAGRPPRPARSRPLRHHLGRALLDPLAVAAADHRLGERPHLQLDLLAVLGEELADHVVAAGRADQQLV